MEKVQGFRVNFVGKLPDKGFYLTDQEDFVFLWWGGKLVATYGKNASPEVIEGDAKEYFRLIKESL